MKPFLLITTRENLRSAREELELYQRLTELDESTLQWIGCNHQQLELLTPSQFSGVFIAGSPYTHTDTVALKSEQQRQTEASLQVFLNRVLAVNTPYFGVCYGLGALARATGVTLDRSFPEKSGSVSIELTRAARTDPVFSDLPRSFDAFVGHKECVPRVPKGAHILATSPECPVQAVRWGQNAYATQFHPELTPTVFELRVRESTLLGYFEPDEEGLILKRSQGVDVRAANTLLRRFVQHYG